MTGAAVRHACLAVLPLALALGCQPDEGDQNGVSIGLLLSYTGQLAAGSSNSERALIMAVEAANAAGGPGGRPVRILARDTRSDPTEVLRPARDLLAARAALFIGPDTAELAVQLVPLLGEQTLILPSFATSHSPFRRPPGWFVLGTGTARIACELHAQLSADQRKKPLAIVDPNGYNNLLGWEFTRRWGVAQVVLPSGQASDTGTIDPVTAAHADSFVLAASPASATSLLFALAATGNLHEPQRFYLTPTLHTPALLQTIPKAALQGAHGVAPGTGPEAAAFHDRFVQRWQDEPLDDAYPFYDAGAIAVLALGRALAQDGAVPDGTRMREHVYGVTRRGGKLVPWNALGEGLQALGAKQEITYQGLSGPVEFDLSGLTATASTRWWTIGPGGFEDVPDVSDCP